MSDLNSPKNRLILAIGLALTSMIGGCNSSSSESTNTATATDSTVTSAVGKVSTTSSAVISTPAGAAISVPPGAVPLTTSSQEGEVTFSLEKSSSIMDSTPPSGVTAVSDIYNFGPEGMVFQTPVLVTLPITGTVNSDDLPALYRIDPLTGEHQRYPSSYDRETNTVSAQTYHFSPWYIGSTLGGANDGKADGCFKVDNSTTYQWRQVYVQSFTPKYPEQASSERPSSLWSNSSCSSGWCSQGDWYLRQGTYNFCVDHEDQTTHKYSRGFIGPVDLNSPWSYYQPTCTGLGIGIALDESGRCDSAPTPTPTFGTGELQVTLTWHSDPSVDLDLWVTEPDGTKIKYDNETSASGGTLDRDNQCDDYIDGRPENIFWSVAQSGQYKIEVDYYGTCNSSSQTVNYTLRVINQGETKTYTGSIGPYETQVVDTITLN